MYALKGDRVSVDAPIVLKDSKSLVRPNQSLSWDFNEWAYTIEKTSRDEYHAFLLARMQNTRGPKPAVKKR